MIEMFTAIGMVVTALFLMFVVDEVFQSLRKRFRKPEETDNTTSESLPGYSTVSFTYHIVPEEKKEEP